MIGDNVLGDEQFLPNTGSTRRFEGDKSHVLSQASYEGYSWYYDGREKAGLGHVFYRYVAADSVPRHQLKTDILNRTWFHG